MSRVFAYCRVSTTEQTTDNQVVEIRAAGFNIDPRRVVAECVSGSIAAKQRAGFRELLDRLKDGDVLIFTKLDRLGRNAMDVRATVEELATMGVSVHCLALGAVDLTSAAGKMTMTVQSAVADRITTTPCRRSTSDQSSAISSDVRRPVQNANWIMFPA